MTPKTTHKAFGGTLTVYRHESSILSCGMEFAVFVPSKRGRGRMPCLWYLSGLTCSWANVAEKGGILRLAAEHGFIVVMPDTSPRGEDVADDEAYDLGQGAGFYLTATQAPWSKHYLMDAYITEELQRFAAEHLPLDTDRQGILGHSMGGHGALVLHLKNPALYRSCTAFAPITAPSQAPWGQKAFSAYLGADRALWAENDAAALALHHPSKATILIDQGTDDPFLTEQLQHGIFEDACKTSGQSYTLRMQEGYDHSYYFVSSFMDKHIRHHKEALSI